ncbi:cache domain-containing protein [Rhodoferax sp.]|uniref:cache domain-containing protein n=1 Tax=Rhodoferax sp. TaxID=50421 RepID=UPI00374D8694
MNLGMFKGSIRIKMLGGVLALEILLAACYAGVLYYSATQSINLNAQKVVEQSQGVFNLLVDNDSKMLGAAMDSFATNTTVSQIFADHQDRQALISAVQDIYRSNKSRYGITHMYFIDKNGTCYLRAHGTQLSGDTIDRETFLRARASGKESSGIELGKTAFALRRVMPYIHNGSVVGYLEFGEEIDHFDRLMKKQTGIDVAVLVEKSFLNEDDYRGALKATSKTDNWDAMKDYVMVSSTMSDPNSVASMALGSEIRSVKAATYLGTVTEGASTFARGAFPLKDAAGKQVGVVLALSDVSDQIQSQRLSLIFLALITIVIFVVSFVSAHLYLRSEIINPLVQLAEQANDISMGNIDHTLETQRQDEIGVLIRSFERMRASLKKSLSMLAKRSEQG